MTNNDKDLDRLLAHLEGLKHPYLNPDLQQSINWLTIRRPSPEPTHRPTLAHLRNVVEHARDALGAGKLPLRQLRALWKVEEQLRERLLACVEMERQTAHKRDPELEESFRMRCEERDRGLDF